MTTAPQQDTQTERLTLPKVSIMAARRGVVPTAGAPVLRKPHIAQPPANVESTKEVAGAVEALNAAESTSAMVISTSVDPFLDLPEVESPSSSQLPDEQPMAQPLPVARLVAPKPGVFSKVLPARAPTIAHATVNIEAQVPPQAAKLPDHFSEAVAQVQQRKEAGEPSFYEQVSRQTRTTQGMKEMASMRALSRLLEAVYQRPGGDAPVQERIAALQELVGDADAIAQEMVKAFGYSEGTASQYVMAQAMESVVGLVSKSWERDETVNWSEMIAEAGVDPLIVGSAEAMAHAVYKPVSVGNTGKQVAQERLGISLHNAYWEVYLLGDQCDGITPEVASKVVRSISEHVQAQSKFNDLDLRVSWMQGSIKRLTGLFCAQMRSLDAAPTEQDIDRAVQLAKDGFDGVEFHATQLLEMCRFSGAGPQPVDAPSRPGLG